MSVLETLPPLLGWQIRAMYVMLASRAQENGLYCIICLSFVICVSLQVSHLLQA